MRLFKKKENSASKQKDEPISKNLDKNLAKVKDLFEFPLNRDFIIRDILMDCLKTKGIVIYMQGCADKAQVEKNILMPLLNKHPERMKEHTLHEAMEKMLSASVVKKVPTFRELVQEIIIGNSILLADGYADAVSVSTSGFESRQVPDTKIENVIIGSKEAFVESSEINRSLIRKYVKNEKLVAESINVGDRSLYEVSLMYIKGLANEELVENVRKRIMEVQVDGMVSISQLQQHMEERTYSLVPSILYTERPDRAASFLMEGYVVVSSGSPGCLIVPVTIWSFFHTAEDQYQRWAYANFIRIIRMTAYIIALLTPGTYIALSVFHISMIPTDLVLAIAATRELVPFPVLIEVVMMEISFELIREAGARVPVPLGATISIMGALILGQAAVQAGIVSPILVIVVAITGLASYAIPESSTNYMVRISRFLFVVAGAFMGFYGLSLLFMIIVAYLVSLKSFNIPFLSPKAPYSPSSKDMILRRPMWKQWLRPTFINPRDAWKAEEPKGRLGQK
jgi:spore germination protein KA